MADELVDAADAYLRTIQLHEDDSSDRAILTMLLCLAIHTARKVDKMAVDFSALNQAVTDNTAAVNEAVAVINAGNDDAAVQAQIDANTQMLQSNNAALNSVAPVPVPEG